MEQTYFGSQVAQWIGEKECVWIPCRSMECRERMSCFAGHSLFSAEGRICYEYEMSYKLLVNSLKDLTANSSPSC